MSIDVYMYELHIRMHGKIGMGNAGVEIEMNQVDTAKAKDSLIITIRTIGLSS